MGSAYGILSQSSAEKNQQNVACRSYRGVHDTVDHFRFHAYASCFTFLFYQLNPKTYSNSSESQPVVDFIYKRQIRQLDTWDYENETVKSNVCSFLSRDECQRWILCCEAADNCCERQLALPVKTNETCGRIWDGWLCWDEADRGTLQYSSCPLFVPYFMPSRQAVRLCGDNGKWIQKTDYSPCLKKEELETTIFTGLGCSVTSIVFLLPSIIIFLKYKTLRNQHRIRLHINLFLSLMLKEVMEIMWDMLVTYDKVTSTEVADAALIKNGVGCKLLSFMKIYFKCCCYTWMFCEGFYLHRLMSNAFSPPSSLLPIYVLGWTIPLVSSSIYGVLRGIYNDESCWAYGYNNFEWIFDAPNVVFLVLNLVFLTNILRILLTQLQSHPNEPGNFRKAVKATFILIPLFGIQLFVTIYRVPISEEGGLEYERVTVIVNHTQGFFVAMVFCFLNTEVISNLRRSWRHQTRNRSLSSSKRLNHTIHHTLSVRSEYDVTRDYNQSKNSLLETGQETEEIELKETSLLNGHRENVSLE
ncbi:calcitonin gene-related peptide type 1 receptor-like [Saccostrea echinata]|uniref:calcitonin gene-related peptide type 1 receptor-like n=1 Tax=Saccostrea echinata TaxID=191078 RepID=UPI002A829498|nr:calcitonin gene-related peptide type 1 receptor-like [Saccostrea echinata]